MSKSSYMLSEIDGAFNIGRKVMEVFLYNSTVCRLCGEENDNGTFLYSTEENNESICDLVNTFLPIKVYDDGQLPRTICPGCTIQLEATVEFITLIINGQKVIRALHKRETEYKKTVLNSNDNEEDIATENFVHEVSTENGVYQSEHPATLNVAGHDKPKRKRGRPPKKHKTPQELAQEAAAKERELQRAKQDQKDDELSGKRKRKTPTRFKEVVQGKELEKIFIEEGVTDGEDSEPDIKPVVDFVNADPVLKVPEVIGHTDSGELVVVVKGKGRGRPKGRLHQKRQKCAICDKEFSCSGRYMSHIAQHGPVMYQCQQCSEMFSTRLDFTKHQDTTGHQGQNVIPCEKKNYDDLPTQDPLKVEPNLSTPDKKPTNSLPDLNPIPAEKGTDFKEGFKIEVDKVESVENGKSEIPDNIKPENGLESEAKANTKLPCAHCDKQFSSRQSRSMHIRAVHRGERPYTCSACGASFAYPRALALHAVRHRGRRHKGYACDLCGKVLNHPSSVTYHKEAEHANQKFVCNKCGKSFKHKQLLQRHQLVHTQNRPFECKLCNATFKTKANLLNHQLLHSGVKKYSCELCKQKFAHKTSLTLHMRWHKGQKPYACMECGKAFSQKGNLSEHARIHTGEKPFQCAHCPRRFTTSSQHRLHIRRHINKDKPAPTRIVAPPPPTSTSAAAFKCAWCGRACGSRWALAKHSRRHTGERPFKCPHCPRAFADCSNLNKHKKHVHKQVSLLASPAEAPALTIIREEDQADEDNLEESVIYVTYDLDDSDEPNYHLVDAEQAAELMKQVEEGPVAVRALYADCNETDSPEASQEHMAVTDEQGNPLHFTMQDGTQLAITSLDGQSLQVITQDGQTIPVEINGLTSEVHLEDPAPVHEFIAKPEDDSASSPITRYYTIV